MPAINSAAQIGAKWARVTPTRTQDYEDGIRNPRKDWQQATQAAAPAYVAGLQQSLANKSWDKGVARAGTAKWQANAIAKGPSRWAAGVGIAQANYETGFKPYADAIAAINLPPRGAKGDPGNIQRVAVLAAALHKVKLSQGR